MPTLVELVRLRKLGEYRSRTRHNKSDINNNTSRYALNLFTSLIRTQDTHNVLKKASLCSLFYNSDRVNNINLLDVSMAKGHLLQGTTLFLKTSANIDISQRQTFRGIFK